jgi:hypothetical protein
MPRVGRDTSSGVLHGTACRCACVGRPRGRGKWVTVPSFGCGGDTVPNYGNPCRKDQSDPYYCHDCCDVKWSCCILTTRKPSNMTLTRCNNGWESCSIFCPPMQ